MYSMMFQITQSQPNLSTGTASSTFLPMKEAEDSSLFYDFLQGNLGAEKAETGIIEEAVDENSFIEKIQSLFLLLDDEEWQEIISNLEEVLEMSFGTIQREWENIPKNDQIEEIITLLETFPNEVLHDLTSRLEARKNADEIKESKNHPIPTIEEPAQVLTARMENSRHFQELFNKVAEQIEGIETGEDLEKLAVNLLSYLTDWQQVANKSSLTLNETILSLEGEKETVHLWQNLVQRYQQKMNLHSKNVYALESRVSNTDIVRWLGSLLGANVHDEKQGFQSREIPAHSPLPIAKVEQFVIHLPQQREAGATDRSLIEQFQRLIDVNRSVLIQPKGQLSIALKPANLGDMLVRFTQVNGETMVRIMVTTTVAKEMLEGNMQQLRHLFAPHQVVVEKQDLTTQSAQETQNEDASDKEEKQEEHPTESNEQEEDETSSFSRMFEELIVNEKV